MRAVAIGCWCLALLGIVTGAGDTYIGCVMIMAAIYDVGSQLSRPDTQEVG